MWIKGILLQFRLKGNFGTETKLAEYIRLQRATNEEQVHFAMLLSASNVLRSERNVQMKVEYKTAVFKRGYFTALSIAYFSFFFGICFLRSLRKTALSGISQGAELMVWFSAGLAKPAHSTAVPAQGGVGTCGKGLLTAESYLESWP